MKLLGLGIGVLLTGLTSFAGLNYNASKSNTGNIIVTPEFVTTAQASAILAEIEKAGKTPDEPAVRAAMTKSGVSSARIAKIMIHNSTTGVSNRKTYSIMLLDDPSSEAAANAAVAKVSNIKGAAPQNR